MIGLYRLHDLLAARELRASVDHSILGRHLPQPVPPRNHDERRRSVWSAKHKNQKSVKKG